MNQYQFVCFEPSMFLIRYAILSFIEKLSIIHICNIAKYYIILMDYIMTEKKIQNIENNKTPKLEEKNHNSEIKNNNNVKTKKLDPTRYGDWEVNGIAVDF